jgi:type IV secretion system protein VirB10
LLATILLFGFLDNRRRELTAPTTTARAVDHVGTVSALPPLVFPSVPPPPPVPLESDLNEPAVAPVDPGAPAPPVRGSVEAQPAPQSQYVPRPPSRPAPAPTYSPPQAAPPPMPTADPRRPSSTAPTSVLVYDAAAQLIADDDRNASAEPASATPASREAARSSLLGRRAATVPEGTLIPAVLETALDSSRPGFARAIVSRDVTGFDGSRVLIPRGSRLFGNYQTELGAGQNRATVQWTRLVRPDGVTIALDSPAADPSGRSGVEGRVNNRYLERFASALLQTTLNVAANLAGRSLSDGAIIVALPSSTQTSAAPASDHALRPTLRVDAGTRVSVLVARDLEFASGERRR